MPCPMGGSSWGLPSRLEYLSPQGVFLPQVYGTIVSPPWLELRGLSPLQATPSWTVYRLACHRLLPWLWVTLPWSPMQPGPARTSSFGVPCLLLARCVGWVARVRSTHRVWYDASIPSAALGAHVCAVSTAPWRLFTGVRTQRSLVCGVHGHLALVHRCARLVCSVRAVLGHLASVHRCDREVCCVCCVLGHLAPITSVPAWCVVSRVRCPWPLPSWSAVCPSSVLCCVCGILGHLASVQRCACAVCCVRRPWPPGCCSPVFPVGVLCVRCPWPLGSCSPVCALGVLCRVCGVLGQLVPVHRCACGVCCVCGVLGHLALVLRCARSVCCAACAVSLATWLLFGDVPAQCAVYAVSLATWLL